MTFLFERFKYPLVTFLFFFFPLFLDMNLFFDG